MFDFLYELLSITNDFFAQFLAWDDDDEVTRVDDISNVVTQS